MCTSPLATAGICKPTASACSSARATEGRTLDRSDYGSALRDGAVIVAIVLFAIRGSMLRSDVYADALARARAHPELVATIGTPITPGFMPIGSVSTSTEDGGSGRADLVIGIEGPRGEGRLVASADRRLGAWTWESLLFVPGDNDPAHIITIAAADMPVEHHASPVP